jgi:hypothetical protein
MPREQSRPSPQISKRVRSVPVTRRALTTRIARALAAEGKELRKTRGAPAIDALGRYYVIGGNSVLGHHVDLETLGRETGALADYEYLWVDGLREPKP